MATKRAALVEVGLAKPSRGKFSGEALAWLDAQRAKGVKFDDDDVVKPVRNQKPTGDSAPTEVKKENTGVGYPDYIFPSDFRYPEDEYQAVAHVDGKRVVHSMRECCSNCRVSLTNHGCDQPVIHGSISVKVERR